jgi:hypothetical protein
LAFWLVGTTPDKPYRSIDQLTITDPVGGVIDVPGTKLKILSAKSGASFFVLDLAAREAAKLEIARSSSGSAAALSVSSDGRALLALAPNGTDLSIVDLQGQGRHPTPLFIERPASFVFDIRRSDDGGRSIVAIHPSGDVGATVFDRATLDSGASRLYSGLLLGGLAEGNTP